MSTFGWSEEYVSEVLTGGQAWAYYAWAVENRASFFGCALERVNGGYIAAEIKLLKANK